MACQFNFSQVEIALNIRQACIKTPQIRRVEHFQVQILQNPPHVAEPRAQSHIILFCF